MLKVPDLTGPPGDGTGGLVLFGELRCGVGVGVNVGVLAVFAVR